MHINEHEFEWLIEATIQDIQKAMNEGSLDSERLVAWYLGRIEAFDQQGPRINSLLEVNPDALAIARTLDQERANGSVRGPLHGIPIALKDSIETADQMHTSAGSRALANWSATQDAYIAKQLRDAGAVLLGKTNMTEWANFMSAKMPAGYSSRGGQVLNPYGPGTYLVGGSSTGSATVVAANFATASIGTETSGSIIAPAVQNSIVGMKPTVGLASRSGIIPIARSQDTPGPMARTVSDLAILLGVIAGVDGNDRATWDSEGKTRKDYTVFLEADGLRGARIGVPRQYYAKLDKQRRDLMEQAIQHMIAHGAVIIDPVTIPSATSKWARQVLRYEFKHDINAYLSKLGSHVPVHSLQELIAFHEDNADVFLRYGQNLLIWSEETSGTLSERSYIDSRRRDIEQATVRGIDFAINEHRLDALLFPGPQGADITARAGYPSITVPCGYMDGIPYGLTFTGTAYREPTLIKLAYAYEQATKHRKPPMLG